MSKILVPLVVWNLGICFDPESKLVEIREGNASIAHSLDQVLPQRGGKVHNSILGITYRKPCVRVPRQGAQPRSDPLQIESARQVRRRPSPFVVLPRDLLRRVQ